MTVIGKWSELDGNLASFLLHTLPLAIIIIDEETRVQLLNEAAQKLFQTSGEEAQLKMCGDVFRCINACLPEGCGGSSICLECVVRKGVRDAVEGKVVSRSKGKFDLIVGGEQKRLTLLVTAAPLDYRGSSMAILLIEDVSLITQLQGLVPICAACHRIRDRQGEWTSLGRYIEANTEAELTHDYCPVCAEELLTQRKKSKS